MLEVQTWMAVFTNLALAGFSSEQMAQWIPAFFAEGADGEPPPPPPPPKTHTHTHNSANVQIVHQRGCSD